MVRQSGTGTSSSESSPMPDREISLVDTTVRDGHQSLWSANALSTPMIAEIAPVLDRVGFHAVDFTSSTHMAMAVRWHREDPWERIRVVRDLMPETRLGFITPGMRFMAWWRAPADVIRLALACVIRTGVRRIWVAESMNDVTTDLAIAEIVRDEGAEEVVVGLVYSISPVHTDDYYAERARAIAASPHVDVLNLKDPGGLLTPERVRTLVPALRAAAPNLPLEVHSHMTATMGAACYAEAAELGASFLCTAARPLANGTSQPSAEQTIANLREQGFRVDLDDDALHEVSRYFTNLAAELDLPVGAPIEYDVSVYKHQLPGGMTSTLRRQLAEIGMEHRWHDILDEIPRVREELGWPIMVTPLSQFVGVQAFLNVTGEERWSRLPDEVIRYVLGQYGPPAGEIDPDLKARVLASPRAEELADEEHGMGLEAARARYGDAISDEQLLLRMMLPEEQVEAIGPPTRRRSVPPDRHPLCALVAGLVERSLDDVVIERHGLRLRARRGSAA
jgi:oxaloacetate decarboxylase (Na+ extruding) subunit alpha